MLSPNAALLELRALVGTYLEGSDDGTRAAELFDVLAAHLAVSGPYSYRVGSFSDRELSISLPTLDLAKDKARELARGPLLWKKEAAVKGVRPASYYSDRDFFIELQGPNTEIL